MSAVPKPTGTVIATWHRDWHDDWDDGVVLWTGGAVERVMTGTTRWASCGNPLAEYSLAPLTPAVEAEVRAALAPAHVAGLIDRAWAAATDPVAGLIDRAWAAATDPVVGRHVEISRGPRKGRQGWVVWRGANQFRTYYRNGYNKPEFLSNQRLGIVPDGGGETLWTSGDNVRVTDPPFDLAAVHADAEAQVASYPLARLVGGESL